MRTIELTPRKWRTRTIGVGIAALMVGWGQATTMKPAAQAAAQTAQYIGEARCIECHGQENTHFSETLHAKIFRLNPKNDRQRQGCEACHGPGSEHAKNALDKTKLIGFTRRWGTPVDVQNGQCLNCHEGGNRLHWPGSAHAKSTLACSDCHNPMQKLSASGLLARQSISEACYQCHQQQRAEFRRRLHMPLPEGKGLLNNGSGGSFETPNLTVGNNPPGTLATGYNGTGCNYAATRALGLAPSAGDVPIRNVPYEYRQLNSIVTAEYRLNRTNSLEGTYERENFDRKYRDRDETWEDKIRLGYVNRALENGTLRLSYEYGHRRGSDFLATPLAEFYSISFGPVPTANTRNMVSWLRNVDQFRRFDVDDRNQNVFNARLNYGIGPALDVSVALQARDAEYPASEYGRNEHYRLTSPSLELNWQPSPATTAYGFYSYQQGAQHQVGLQPNACVMGNFYFFFSDGSVQTNATGVPPAPPAGTSLVSTQQVLPANWRSLCGTASAVSPLFPISRSWDVSQKDHNNVTGLGFHYEMNKVLYNVAYTYFNGRTKIGYGYNPAALGLNATQVALAGDGWSDLVFPQNIVEANAMVPIRKRLSLRLLYRYEDGHIRDWHYDGISVNPMPANNGAYLDFGPQDYKVHLFGALFRYEL